MKSDKSTPNVPTLRFKSFEQEWEYSTIGKCSISLEYGMNAAAVKYDGKHKYIRITDIDEETSAFIPNPLSSPDGEFEQRYLVKENDILFARTGASVGKSYLYNHNDGELYFAGFLIRARIKAEYNGTFIYYQTKSKKYDRWVKLTSMRSGQPGINSQEYSDYSIAITGKVEQDKIADFFQMLDNRIAVQNKIIEDLKILKKELCSKLFNSMLCDSEIQISQIANVYGGYAFSSKTYVDNGKYKIVTIGNVTGDKFISGNLNTIDELPNNIQMQQMLNDGDILISLTGNVGRISIVRGEDYLLNQRVAKLNIKDKWMKEFIYQYLSSSSFEKDMCNAGQGAAQKNIKNEDILSYRIHIPSNKNVLEKIAIFLIAYDKKINNEELILLQLQTQKSYFLNAMFI